MTIYEALSRQEVKYLIQASDLRGFQAILCTWVVIAFSFALVAYFPSFVTILLALVLLGGRHLALGILMHDASHYSLFKTRKLNDFIGGWICASPTWQDLKRYRTHHLTHHRYAVSAKDPDLSLVSNFPISRKSLIRKMARDILGVSGIKRVYGLLLMDLGFIKYTVSSEAIPLDQGGRTPFEILKTGAKNLSGVVLTNFFIFAVLYAFHHPWLYALWVGSYLTTFSLFVRIRSIAEHACTALDLDPARSSRTTYANPIARLTVAPHRVNYHLEHHLAMTIPYFNLPKAHQLLKERGALKSAHIVKNYWEVLKIATSSVSQK